MRSKRNFFIFFTIFIFASVVIYLASQFRELPPILQRGLQPSTFPIICAVLIILLGFILWMKSDKEKDTLDANFNRMTIKLLLIIPIFILVLNIDFFLAVTLFSLAIHILWTNKIKIVPIILLGIILPVFVYVLFEQVLGVKFPDGIVISYARG
ncbi:tripartite tricarboxylate transporter TctB family protein [Gallibacterium anatis]|uniref:tripartite tricarboxylate transporter TctB family protein n=1 Tax=Gallibacterium anatis TaxID=750 RepID=UPI0006915D50|nr:tripartite tricarboxylate transporter TctB family protein [Gallibacterium anatis]MBP4134227.1 tripartite tricarboxylate transporter TctB family protein [Gallibacterium anatis]